MSSWQNICYPNTIFVILNLIQDLTRFFFKLCLISFFLFLLCFYFFHKNYYYFSKGRETARSPKPAVSLPLTPSLFGHGLRRCLKNLADSEVNSHYNKILVILNLIQDLTHFFSNIVWFLFFYSFFVFIFFIKIIITSSLLPSSTRICSRLTPFALFSWGALAANKSAWQYFLI